MAIHPECERAQNLAFRQIFGDPDAGDIHGQSDRTHQGAEEFLTRLRGSALKKVADKCFWPALYGSAAHTWTSLTFLDTRGGLHHTNIVTMPVVLAENA